MARRLFTIACWLAHLVAIWPGTSGEAPDGADTLPLPGDGVAEKAAGAVRDVQRADVRHDELRRTASFDDLSPRFAPDLGRTR